MSPSLIANILDIDLSLEVNLFMVMFDRFCDAKAFAELCDEFSLIDVVINLGRNHTFVSWKE